MSPNIAQIGFDRYWGTLSRLTVKCIDRGGEPFQAEGINLLTRADSMHTYMQM